MSNVKDYFIGSTSFLNKNKLYQTGVMAEINKNLVIYVDTREKKNEHIISYFEKNKIQYESKKLDIGDYSYYIKPNKYVPYGFNASNVFTIDRKQNVDEIVGNLINDRERFEKELMRSVINKMTFILMIEEEDALMKMYTSNYRSKATSKSVINSFYTFVQRYGIEPYFIGSITDKETIEFILMKSIGLNKFFQLNEIEKAEKIKELYAIVNSISPKFILEQCRINLKLELGEGLYTSRWR